MHSCLLTLADGHKSEVVNVHRNRICLPSPAPSRSLVWIESWSKEIFLDHIFEKQPCVPSFVQVCWGGNLGLEVALPSYHPRKDDGWTPQFLVICLILHDDGQGLDSRIDPPHIRLLVSQWKSGFDAKQSSSKPLHYARGLLAEKSWCAKNNAAGHNVMLYFISHAEAINKLSTLIFLLNGMSSV